MLYQTIQHHFSKFAQTQAFENGEKQIPEYVEKEFEAYLKCGILEHGFIQLACENCHIVHRVALSCKRRGFCPSCIGKRMNEGGAFLMDHVFPHVPVRQWVLSFPMPVRFWMAKNPRLLSSLLSIFMRAVHGYYHKSVLATLSPDSGPLRIQTGSVTVVQRFGSALNLNIHFHALFLDGCYVTQTDGSLLWVNSYPNQTEEIQKVLKTVQARMIRHLQKRGLVPRAESENGGSDTPDETDLISEIQGASVLYKTATGENQGKKIRKVGSLGSHGDDAFAAGHLAAILAGFTLHASVHVPKEDRERLEQLCRYLLRPPLPEKRLKKLQNGDLAFEMKTTWGDGTRAIVFTPQELIEKLIAIIPQPRIHQVRFHGILGPSATDRSKVVPKQAVVESAQDEKSKKFQPKNRLSWAELLRRTFQVDLSVCGLCGGAVKFVKAVMKADEIKLELERLGQEPTPG